MLEVGIGFIAAYRSSTSRGVLAPQQQGVKPSFAVIWNALKYARHTGIADTLFARCHHLNTCCI